MFFSPTVGSVVYNVADNTVDSALYFDTRVVWTVSRGKGSFEVYGNINNMSGWRSDERRSRDG